MGSGVKAEVKAGTSSETGNFLNARKSSNPSTNADGEAGNPVGVGDKVASNNVQRNEFNLDAKQFEEFASTVAQRNPVQLSDGSLIDNHGFVYTRNLNGSVTSRVATVDQLQQSGIKLDFDNISTATPSQSAIPRNINEKAAFDDVFANPQNGENITKGDDVRFSSAGFKKMEQKIAGPNGKRISIHYQYNYEKNQVVDMKVVSPIKNSQ